MTFIMEQEIVPPYPDSGLPNNKAPTIWPALCCFNIM
jgi:hypothetical protein